MNRITLTGILGKDPEIRFIAGSGKAVTNFDIAVKRDFKKDETDWFPIVVFGKIAESCANYLGKGSKVLVSGRAEYDHWKDDQGNNRTKLKVIADKIEFLTFKESQQQPQQQTNYSDSGLGFGDFQAIEDDSTDDIPF